MYCSHCEKNMPKDFKFCPVCGSPAPKSPPQPTHNPYSPPQPTHNPYSPPQPNYNQNPPPQPNYNQNPPPQPNYNPQYHTGHKDENTTLILSIILGLIGLPGIGHMYVGKVGKGVGILIGSWILIIVGVATLGIGLIVYLILFIWQIFDSRNLCRQYNQYLSQNGRPPW